MEKLLRYLLEFYQLSDFPAVAAQIHAWRTTRPLAKLKILDATPIFRNTMTKYCALLAAGAEVTVTWSDKLPRDEKICALLPDFGIRVSPPGEWAENFDLIADCAGFLAALPAKYGHVELTRSGLYAYADAKYPVFSADSGRLKKLETILGTGDGFIRGMEKLSLPVAKQNLLIFGGGKVGFGIAAKSIAAGAQVTVADPCEVLLPPGCQKLDPADTAATRKAIDRADIIVTVTGIAGALAPWAEYAAGSAAVLVSMSPEDEFGSFMPAGRMLNNKKPLNFVLEEPTHLRYIDATFALNNLGLLKLTQQQLPPGISVPQNADEEEIFRTVITDGKLAAEAELIEKYIWR